MAKRRNPGAIQSVALVVVSLGALSWVGYNLVPSNFTKNAARAVTPLATSARSQALLNGSSWLGVLGMDTESLAAAGVNAEGASFVLTDLQAFMDSSGDAFIAAIDADNAAKLAVANDERAIRAGKSPEDQAVSSHAATHAATNADKAARLSAAIAAASGRLTDDQRAKLAMIRANAGREVPVAYRMSERTDAQWVQLRNALTAERQSAARGESAPLEVRSVLQNVRSEPATAQALQNVAAAHAGP